MGRYQRWTGITRSTTIDDREGFMGGARIDRDISGTPQTLSRSLRDSLDRRPRLRWSSGTSAAGGIPVDRDRADRPQLRRNGLERTRGTPAVCPKN